MTSSVHDLAVQLLPGRRPRVLAAALLCAVVSACAAQNDSALGDSQPAQGIDRGAAAAPADTTVAPVDAAASGADAPQMREPAANTSASATAAGWRYDPRTSPSGATVPRALVTSRSGLETLVFEHHPVSGRDAILELSAPPGCELGCKVSWRVDGGTANEVPASRLESQPTWLSVRQPRELWKALLAGRVLEVTYEGSQGAMQATFDVAGADASRLPGWER